MDSTLVGIWTRREKERPLAQRTTGIRLTLALAVGYIKIYIFYVSKGANVCRAGNTYSIGYVGLQRLMENDFIVLNLVYINM